MVFGFGKKKKPEETEGTGSFTVPEGEIGDRLLPEDLERFKLKGPFEEMLAEKPAAKEPRPEPRTQRREVREENDLELVLSKLDVIDARLRVIEEKLKRL